MPILTLAAKDLRLLLRDPARSRELLSELQAATGVTRVSLFHRSDEAEV